MRLDQQRRQRSVWDWIEQGVTSHSTHLGHFGDGGGDCGISQDCSHSQSPVCAVLSSVCATTVDNSGVLCIIWKALCPYVLDARLGLWVSLEHAFTCVSTTNQAERRSSATHLLARWEHESTTASWSRAQGGGSSVTFSKINAQVTYDTSARIRLNVKNVTKRENIIKSI